MPRPVTALILSVVSLCAASLVPEPASSVSAAPGMACPVLYRYSQHFCYVAPTALTIMRAEQQMPVRVVSPVESVRRFTSLQLASVIVDRTRRDTGVLHAWIIDYVFGHAPDLGLPSAVVSRSARFVVIGEAAGRIALAYKGVNAYDQPRFGRIRVNSVGRAIWTVSVNLPHRNASLGILSTLPRATLERLIRALMQQSAGSTKG